MEQPTTQSLNDHNKDYWGDKAASAFEQGWAKVLSKQIARTIQDFAPLLLPKKDPSRSGPVRMLDYACGNGLATWALKEQVNVARGIDTAPGMVTLYNKRARDASLPESEMQGLQGDLLGPTASNSTPDLYNFDLAVTSMALHHFLDPEAAVKALVGGLRPGGTVAVVDWAPSEGDSMPWEKGKHEASHTVHKNTRENLAWENVLSMLGRAGCDLSTAYYAIMGNKSHMPEEVTKVPGGVYVNGFLAFAKKGRVRSLGNGSMHLKMAPTYTWAVL